MIIEKYVHLIVDDGVTSIGEGAFSGCSSLRSMEIPDGVTSIKYRDFAGCDGLTVIFWRGVTYRSLEASHRELISLFRKADK